MTYTDRLPRPGETVGGAAFERFGGGKGANQAVAAARLGATVRLVACVGDDDFAEEALSAPRTAGVDTTRVRRLPGVATGVAVIIVASGGENIIVVAPGANGRLAPEHVDVAPDANVMCQLEIPLEAIAAAAERTTGMFCLNAAPAREVPESILRRADVVVVNRYERDALSAEARLLAVTLGEEGAVLIEEGREVARASPPPVDAVDGTAAGDAFCAALFVGLLEGRAGDAALRRACAAGAIAASRAGAQPSLPAAAEVDAIVGP